MPFPPISLHQRITSPGRDLFRKKKSSVAPPPPAEEKQSDKEKFTRSWPSANLRSLGRKKTKSPTRTLVVVDRSAEKDHHHHRAACSWLPVSKSQGSCGDVTRSSSTEESATATRAPPPRGGGGKQSSRGSPGGHAADGQEEEKEIRFSLSLTPEAILVIQKRNLEKQQMMAKQQKCCVSATDQRHRRVLPSKKAHHHHQQQHQHHKSSGHPAEDAEQDITAIVKISLLNDQYKYDDVEYEEEEDGDAVDETVVRKCKEWLKGVESAAATFGGKVDKLSALPHLKGC